jgi:hypothetical protein
MPPRHGAKTHARRCARKNAIGDASAGPRRAGQASATLPGVAPAPYKKACEEAACGRRGNQSRSDAAAPAALPPPRERGQSRLLRGARGRLRASVRPASLITKTYCSADDRGCRNVGAGCGGEAVVECCTRTSDAEERESGRVQHVDRPSNPAEERVGKDGDETGAAGDGKVTPVTDGGGRDADQQVADDAAGEADNDGEHDDAKEVEPCAHACHAAAEPKRERPPRD